jgi:hypothetical protein
VRRGRGSAAVRPADLIPLKVQLVDLPSPCLAATFSLSPGGPEDPGLRVVGSALRPRGLVDLITDGGGQFVDRGEGPDEGRFVHLVNVVERCYYFGDRLRPSVAPHSERMEAMVVLKKAAI